jgi:hypothetical protein
MENSIVKTRKMRDFSSQKSEKKTKMISEDDIRRRAYEIYQQNIGVSHNALDDWFRAERELKGSDI